MSKIKTAISPFSNIFERVLATHRAKAYGVKAYKEMSDEELVRVIQQGDTDAFEYIVQRYQGKMYAYIMRLINHKEDAHDVTQDVFLKAYRHLQRFDTERKFSSWIYRIAHNECVNWLKKKTRIKMESLESHMENGYQVESQTDIARQYMKEEEQKLIQGAIRGLSPKYRQVMELRYLEQLSYEEISAKLDKPINTIGTLINRAKKRLAFELKELR